LNFEKHFGRFDEKCVGGKADNPKTVSCKGLQQNRFVLIDAKLFKIIFLSDQKFCLRILLRVFLFMR
jgi:hypothetical protein